MDSGWVPSVKTGYVTSHVGMIVSSHNYVLRHTFRQDCAWCDYQLLCPPVHCHYKSEKHSEASTLVTPVPTVTSQDDNSPICFEPLKCTVVLTSLTSFPNLAWTIHSVYEK